MYVKQVAGGKFPSIAIPLPKGYSRAATRVVRGRGGDVYEKDPNMDYHDGRELLEVIAKGKPIISKDSTRYPYDVMIVWCKEHDRPELVPWANYTFDFKLWYAIGRHPRFSIVKMLLEAGQRRTEINDAIYHPLPILLRALEKSNTEKEFLKIMGPHFNTTLYVRGRKLRVTNAFKRKYDEKKFAVNDFFQTGNQELRRAILRVVPIRKVTDRMKCVAKDDEGTIYEMRDSERRYLHVKCPSTGQDYLLEIPRTIQVTKGDDTIDVPLNSPKEARRWTFNLPKGAEFAKEA